MGQDEKGRTGTGLAPASCSLPRRAVTERLLSSRSFGTGRTVSWSESSLSIAQCTASGTPLQDRERPAPSVLRRVQTERPAGRVPCHARRVSPAGQEPRQATVGDLGRQSGQAARPGAGERGGPAALLGGVSPPPRGGARGLAGD